MEMDKYPVVHIYGQYAHHMEAIILGNEKGLIELSTAINKAIFQRKFTKEEETVSAEVFCNDGEGYEIEIQIVKEYDLDKLPVPYTADYGQDKTGINPASFLK